MECTKSWRRPALLALVALWAGPAGATTALKWDSTGHVVVPAMVDGKGPYDFILDTGADESGVYAWLARSLALPKGAERELSGATGSTGMTASRLARLSVDGHAIGPLEAATIPDRRDGAPLGGVAGVDLMAHRLTVIDFGCGTAALLPVGTVGPSITGAGATLVQAGSIRDGQQLTLPVTVNGAAGVAVLDSGARNSQINLKFAAAARLDLASSAFHDAEPARGVVQTAASARIGPIGTVIFAGVTRRDPAVKIGDLPYLEGAGLAGANAMNLGLDLLKGTRLTLDVSARRFWLAPSRCSARP